MNNEPLEREPIDRVRARLEALLKANAAPRCGARSKRTGKPCRGAAMPNGRCKLHGGKSTGPRTPEGLERSRRANWKHGHFSREAKTNGRACGRQYLRSAICATRSKGPRGPAVGFEPHGTIYLTGIDPNGKVARTSARSRFRELTARNGKGGEGGALAGGWLLSGSPADFGKLISDETNKWGKVIVAANIKAK
jgi:hypothetical protein